MMNADWVKVLDPSSENMFPCAKVIGRVYIPDNEVNAMIMCGAAGAADYYNRCKPAYDRAGYVYAWEGPNEPPVQTSQQRQMLCEFTKTWTYLMHNQAPMRHVVALCLGVGWPDIGRAPELAGAIEDADYMGLHEYSAPTMKSDQSWLCLRYRRTMDELRQAGVRYIPPLLITECGIDGGVIGRPGKGWKTFTDRAGYMEQLAWYDNELQKDNYVRAATIFTSGPNYNWQDFDFDQELSKALHAYNC